MGTIELILWVVSAGFGLMLSFMLLLWKESRDFKDEIKKEIRETKIDIGNDLVHIKDDIKELRTSINRMEGAFYNKECCMIKNDQNLKKVE